MRLNLDRNNLSGIYYGIWALSPIHLVACFLVNEELHSVLHVCNIALCLYVSSIYHSFFASYAFDEQKSLRLLCTNISFAHQNRVHSNIVQSMIWAVFYVCENNSTFASDESSRTIENSDKNNCTFSAHGSTYANVYGEQECIWIFKLRYK